MSMNTENRVLIKLMEYAVMLFGCGYLIYNLLYVYTEPKPYSRLEPWWFFASNVLGVTAVLTSIGYMYSIQKNVFSGKHILLGFMCVLPMIGAGFAVGAKSLSNHHVMSTSVIVVTALLYGLSIYLISQALRAATKERYADGVFKVVAGHIDQNNFVAGKGEFLKEMRIIARCDTREEADLQVRKVVEEGTFDCIIVENADGEECSAFCAENSINSVAVWMFLKDPKRVPLKNARFEMIFAGVDVKA